MLLKKRNGITLLEVLIAIFVLGSLVVGIGMCICVGASCKETAPSDCVEGTIHYDGDGECECEGHDRVQREWHVGAEWWFDD